MEDQGFVRIPSRSPTPTSADFPSDSGWEQSLLAEETWFPVVRESKS